MNTSIAAEVGHTPRARTALMYLVLIAVVGLMLLPFVQVFSGSLKTQG